MARRTSIEKLKALRQRHSIREIGRMIGVNESIVRRALSGKTKKSKTLAKPEVKSVVDKAYGAERKRVRKQYKQDNIPTFDLDLPPIARRITYKGETTPSETVEAVIQEFDSEGLLRMLLELRNQQNLKGEEAHVRFFGLGSAESLYPGQKYWGEWEVINDYSDEEIIEFLEYTSTQFDDVVRVRFDYQ